MPTTVAAFNLSIDEADRWLADVEASLGVSRPAAFAGLKATLGVLRDRLPLEVSTRFADQLPAVLATIYLSGPPGGAPRNDRIGDQIGNRLPPQLRLDGETVGRAVFKAIRGRVGITEFRKVLAHLPGEVREQWLGDYVCADADAVARARLALTRTRAGPGASRALNGLAAGLRGWIAACGALGRTVMGGGPIAGSREFRSSATPPGREPARIARSI